MSDEYRVYFEQLSECMSVHGRYRQWMLDESFGRQISRRMRHPTSNKKYNLSLDMEYGQVIQVVCKGRLKNKKLGCVACGIEFEQSYPGQLYFICQKCVSSVFQSVEIPLIQRISNLIDFNDKCVLHLREEKDDLQKFFKEWNTRMVYVLHKIKFYSQNEETLSVSADPFNLLQFIKEKF